MNPSKIRPGFSAAIRKALAERNETAVQLGEAISVSSSTLRTWLNRRRFPKDKAEAIAAYLGWNLSAAEIEASFDIGAWAQPTRPQDDQAKSLYEIFQEQERTALRLSETQAEAQPKLIPMVQAMQKGDVCFHITAADDPPETLPEFDDLRDAITNAVERHAYFVYICPSDQLHRHWLDEFSVRTGNNGSILESRLQYVLRSEVSRLLVGRGHSAESANEIVEQRIIILLADSFPWFSIGSRYTVFATMNPAVKEPAFRVLLSLPGDYGGRLILPRADLFALRIVMAALRHSLGKVTGLQLSEIAVFAYLMEHPDHF